MLWEVVHFDDETHHVTQLGVFKSLEECQSFEKVESYPKESILYFPTEMPEDENEAREIFDLVVKSNTRTVTRYFYSEDPVSSEPMKGYCGGRCYCVIERDHMWCEYPIRGWWFSCHHSCRGRVIIP